ncbi:MAG: hypothetical protein V1491_02930 [archaeon]
MSILNDIFLGLKLNTEKVVVGAITLGAIVGSIYYAKNIGEEIYGGKIGSREIVYGEKVYPCGGFSSDEWIFGTRNQMNVKQGDIEYTLIDESDETSIQNQDFVNDKLERIIIKTGSGKEDLRTKLWYRNTPKDIRIKKIFEQGNNIYNNLRRKIKRKLNKDTR